jgi:hypothetical protein
LCQSQPSRPAKTDPIFHEEVQNKVQSYTEIHQVTNKIGDNVAVKNNEEIHAEKDISRPGTPK